MPMTRRVLALVAAPGRRRARHRPPLAQDARLEAAKKEGKVVWYTSLALPSAEKVAKLFEAAYPGIKVEVHRTGSERILAARDAGAARPTSRTWTSCTPPTPATSCCSRRRSS